MSLSHGVDGHFPFVLPPPTGTASFDGSMISIGLSATAASKFAEDAASDD
jgi:hypothetical protein